jgi:hypothetical protein
MAVRRLLACLAPVLLLATPAAGQCLKANADGQAAQGG